MPAIIDTVFAKTSPKRWFSMTEYEHFGLAFRKKWVYKFGHRTITALVKIIMPLGEDGGVWEAFGDKL